MTRICKAPDCDRPVYARGYCLKHYKQVRKHGRLTPEREQPRNPPICTAPGCSNKPIAKGYCWKHYQQIKRHGHLMPDREYGWKSPICIPEKREQGRCIVLGCEGESFARGYCRRHYGQWWYAQRRKP